MFKLLVIVLIAGIISLSLMINKTYGQSFQDFKEDLNVIKANEGTNKPTMIQEDQFIICNMWQVCQTIDSDDYMTKKSLDKLWNNFDKDLDTYTVKDIIN